MATRSAWTNSADTNEDLVTNLINSGFITHPSLAAAFRANDRAHFVPPVNLQSKKIKASTYNYGPYSDAPQPLGFRATVSAPYVQALALNELAAHITRPNSTTLDVGSGSGIVVGYMSHLASKNGGKVVGVEVIEPLVELSCINLQNSGIVPNTNSTDINATINHVTVIVEHGNGWNGFERHGPFDAIHVGAQAPEVPQALLNQLKPGGRMIIPIGPLQKPQQLMRIDKDLDGNITETSCGTVRFVPLVKEKEENAKWTRQEKNKSAVTSNTSTSTGSKGLEGLEGNQTSKNSGRAVDWDARYKKGWAYGKIPNDFLVDAMSKYVIPFLPTGQLKVLCVADGQGRNGVYMASLGHDVTSIDASFNGMKKAKLLAEQTLCFPERLKTIVCDIDTWKGENVGENENGKKNVNEKKNGDDKISCLQSIQFQKYDIIVDIFSSLDSGTNGEKRMQRMKKWNTLLCDDGWYINECFAPRHHIVRDGRYVDNVFQVENLFIVSLY